MARNHPVVRRLTSLITDFGPISVEDFIAISLGDPEGGYYATQDPFGAAGDFTTSPEISQMFGEMIGAWCADSWERLGAPEPFALIELGPGRGTLMADALRALNTVPACRAAARIHMVETSPTLRASQQSAIADTDATWHLTIPEPSGMPAIFIANEFFDALPIRQFVKSEGRWRERRVDIDSETGMFKFTLGKSSPQSRHADHLITEALDGDILEESDAVRSIVDTIAEYIAAVGGAAIFIDYGHPYSAVGETLQALRGHKPVSPLKAPGTADLTAHVNFEQVAAAAAAHGIRSWGPIGQGAFLERIGIRERAKRLRQGANELQAHDIDASLTRLIGPAEMGTLFKVLALSKQGTEPPAGFGPGP